MTSQNFFTTLHVKFCETSLRIFLSTVHNTSPLLRMELSFRMVKSAKLSLHQDIENHPKETFIRCLRVSCQNHNRCKWLRWKLKGKMIWLKIVRSINRCSKKLNRKKKLSNSLSINHFKEMSRQPYKILCNQTYILYSLQMLCLISLGTAPHNFS